MHQYNITIAGIPVSYIIHHSHRAKYIKLAIRSGALQAIVPSHIPIDPKLIKIIEDFITKKSRWVLSKLEQRKEPRQEYQFVNNGHILYLNQQYSLVTEKVEKLKDCNIVLNHDTRTATLYMTDTVTADDVLRWWYAKTAKELLIHKVNELNRFTNKAVKSIRVKDTKTVWGSCSGRGALNFNWRLIMTPPEVLDYVVIHELSHLREMNHSERFWSIVESQCPGYKSHVTWLKKEGQKLLRMI